MSKTGSLWLRIEPWVVAVMTLAYGTYLMTHINALVFTSETEYDYSITVRWLGTRGVFLFSLVWVLHLSWMAIHRPHGLVAVIAWFNTITLPLMILLNALPYWL